jgi:hypothetical protein
VTARHVHTVLLSNVSSSKGDPATASVPLDQHHRELSTCMGDRLGAALRDFLGSQLPSYASSSLPIRPTSLPNLASLWCAGSKSIYTPLLILIMKMETVYASETQAAVPTAVRLEDPRVE